MVDKKWFLSTNQESTMSNSTNSTATKSIAHDEDHLNSLPTKSEKIRYLATIYTTEGKVDRGVISRILNIRYQHVRNVLITPLKK